MANSTFSSYKLAEELNKRKLTYVGTLQKNKREFPPEMVDVKGLLPIRIRT